MPEHESVEQVLDRRGVGLDGRDGIEQSLEGSSEFECSVGRCRDSRRVEEDGPERRPDVPRDLRK